MARTTKHQTAVLRGGPLNGQKRLLDGQPEELHLVVNDRDAQKTVYKRGRDGIYRFAGWRGRSDV